MDIFAFYQEHKIEFLLLLLVIIWVISPETRWMYPWVVLVLIVGTIILAPMFIFAPLIWIADKIKGKDGEK